MSNLYNDRIIEAISEKIISENPDISDLDLSILIDDEFSKTTEPNFKEIQRNKFQDWLDSCPFDFHFSGYGETRIKGSLKFREDQLKPLYMFSLPESEKT